MYLFSQRPKKPARPVKYFRKIPLYWALLAIAVYLVSFVVSAEEMQLPNPNHNDLLAEGKLRFEEHCGTCHSLALPRSQQLDRKTWRWVIDDMVGEFGADWLTQKDQSLILEYLVQTHGLTKGPGRE